MANYNLTQTGDEVQAYIDSIPVIDVTGTLNGSTISFGSNPYSQIAANYAADCGSIVRLTVGTAVYLLRVTQYDGTNYTASEMSGAHNVVATIGSSSASATIDAGIDAIPTQGSDNLVKSGGVASEFMTDVTKNSVIYPNYPQASRTLIGSYNGYYASILKDGIPDAGWLKEIHIGTKSLTAINSVPCRVSKVIFSNGTPVSLETISTFSIDIPIGDGVVDVSAKKIWLEKDYCIEVDFNSFGNVDPASNLTIHYNTKSGNYMQFKNQTTITNTIYEVNIVVESMYMLKDIVAHNASMVNWLDDKKRVLYPPATTATLNMSGNLNNWVGFATKDDLHCDGYICGVRLCEANVSTTDTTFHLRISRKVRDNNGVITGCSTIEELTGTLKVGATDIIFDTPRRFLKDYVCEVYAPDFGSVDASNNFTIKYRSSFANGAKYVRFTNQSAVTGSLWFIYAIITLDYELPKLKILDIGNSFSEDAFSYVPQLLKSRVDITFGMLYYGGASLSQHNSFLTNESEVYDYEKCVGDGQWQTQSLKSIQYALADEEWDVIVIHEVTPQINTTTFPTNLNTFINNILAHVSYPVKLAYNFVLVSDRALETSVTHYNQVAPIVHDVVLGESCIRWLIPTATAAQNARTTTLQTLGADGNLMYSDGHAQEGVPCYILACATAESILAEMGIQSSIFANNVRPTQDWINANNIPHQNGTSVGVSDANCRIAQMAALQAIKFPFVITDCSTL